MTAEQDEQPAVYDTVPEPSWRKPAGMLLILFLIMIWSGVAVTVLTVVADWHALAQLPLYAFFGIVWIFPVRPLLTWMGTGKFRR